ncbi:hypothetical protein B0H10DRAFT_2197347 [Mycena sp. CBHHK59/15]|nr:hypothetical protein B0H10DRAFT_2197347 [Mycena sp. CBHHK59/15]
MCQLREFRVPEMSMRARCTDPGIGAQRGRATRKVFHESCPPAKVLEGREEKRKRKDGRKPRGRMESGRGKKDEGERGKGNARRDLKVNTGVRPAERCRGRWVTYAVSDERVTGRTKSGWGREELETNKERRVGKGTIGAKQTQSGFEERGGAGRVEPEGKRSAGRKEGRKVRSRGKVSGEARRREGGRECGRDGGRGWSQVCMMTRGGKRAGRGKATQQGINGIERMSEKDESERHERTFTSMNRVKYPCAGPSPPSAVAVCGLVALLPGHHDGAAL